MFSNSLVFSLLLHIPLTAIFIFAKLQQPCEKKIYTPIDNAAAIVYIVYIHNCERGDALNIIIRNSGGPIYEQIVEQVRMAVLMGEIHPGDALPSMRVLASELRVSVITTKRAYEELEREGVIESMVGRGSFVTGRTPDTLRAEGLRKLEREAATAIDTAKRYGFDEMTLHEIIGSLYGGFNDE